MNADHHGDDTDAGASDAGTLDAGPPCIPDGAVDVLDALGVDSNCDGTDGVRARQLYVSATRGDDATAVPGDPDHPYATLTAACRRLDDWLPQLPGHVVVAVHRALSLNPDHRFSDIRAFGAALLIDRPDLLPHLHPALHGFRAQTVRSTQAESGKFPARYRFLSRR